MSHRNLLADAQECRLRADEYNGRPEKALLLRLAVEFDRLGSEAGETSVGFAEEQTYFARRAYQEFSAAVRALHPKARRAHLTLAQSYDAKSQPGLARFEEFNLNDASGDRRPAIKHHACQQRTALMGQRGSAETVGIGS